MLYTGKGDNGTTQLFDLPQGRRLSKSAFIFEALGTIDELNCSLGYAKALSEKSQEILDLDGEKKSYLEIIEILQQNLFCIQAELGGSKIQATKQQTLFLEKIIASIEKLLPRIKTFIVPGGTETGAYLDLVRTVARRAERQVVFLSEQTDHKVSDESISYLNRLSSVLYALARYANFQKAHSESKPNYQ